MNVFLKILSALVTFAPILNKIFDIILKRFDKNNEWQNTVRQYNRQNHGRPAADVESVNELQNRINSPKEEKESIKK